MRSNSRELFGVRIWGDYEVWNLPIGLWFELGRHMPVAMKERWLKNGPEYPVVPGTTTELVPGPGLVMVCRSLGPETLDLWVLVAEFTTPAQQRRSEQKLKENGIAWIVEGKDICVRRRDRVLAMRALELGPCADAYAYLCSVSVREGDPAALVQLLNSLLEAEEVKGFIRVSPQKVGHYLILFVRYPTLGTNPKAKASGLNRRIVSALQEVTTEFEVWQMYPDERALWPAAAENENE